MIGMSLVQMIISRLGIVCRFLKEKVMKIELFMENPTDSFYLAPEDRQRFGTSRLGAKTAYIPTSNHCFMHNGADGLLDLPEGNYEVRLSIRAEADGALLLNRATGRVYRLDTQALHVVERLVKGDSPTKVARHLGVDEDNIQQAVAILKSS